MLTANNAIELFVSGSMCCIAGSLATIVVIKKKTPLEADQISYQLQELDGMSLNAYTVFRTRRVALLVIRYAELLHALVKTEQLRDDIALLVSIADDLRQNANRTFFHLLFHPSSQSDLVRNFAFDSQDLRHNFALIAHNSIIEISSISN